MIVFIAPDKIQEGLKCAQVQFVLTTPREENYYESVSHRNENIMKVKVSSHSPGV